MPTTVGAGLVEGKSVAERISLNTVYTYARAHPCGSLSWWLRYTQVVEEGGGTLHAPADSPSHMQHYEALPPCFLHTSTVSSYSLASQ